MTSLLESPPSAVIQLTDATVFYFGTKTSAIHLLPGGSQFQVVYSPREPYGWEFVLYQLFEDKNGVAILERRELEPDEISYFERLIAKYRLEIKTKH